MGRDLNILDLVHKQFEPERYWLSNILPKSSIILVGGHAKIGKSFVLLNMARSLTLGKDFLTLEPGFNPGVIHPKWTTPSTNGQKCRTLVIDKELGERTLQQRLRNIYAGDLVDNRDETHELLKKNAFYWSKDSGNEDDHQPTFANREGIKMLKDIIEDVDPDVVFLDPIGKMHHYDENQAGEIQKLYDNIEELQHCAKRKTISFVVTHHFGKPARNPNPAVRVDELDPYNFRGSAKWFDLPDGLVMMARTPQRFANGGWEIKMQIKPRHDEELPPVLLGMNQLGDNRVYFRKTLPLI